MDDISPNSIYYQGTKAWERGPLGITAESSWKNLPPLSNLVLTQNQPIKKYHEAGLTGATTQGRALIRPFVLLCSIVRKTIRNTGTVSQWLLLISNVLSKEFYCSKRRYWLLYDQMWDFFVKLKKDKYTVLKSFLLFVFFSWSFQEHGKFFIDTKWGLWLNFPLFIGILIVDFHQNNARTN